MIKKIISEIKRDGLVKFAKGFLFENKTTVQTIAKNTFWLFLAEGVNKGLMFFLTILLARYLGAEGYGQFAFAMSFTALFSVFADFGLSTLTIREVARNNKLAKKYVNNISVMKLFLGVITFSLIVGTIQFIRKSSDVNLLIYLFAGYIIINSFNNFFRSIFRAFEKMQYEAYSKIIQGLTLFGFGLYFLLNRFSTAYIVSAYIFASLISFFINLFYLRKSNIRKLKETRKKLIKQIDFKFWKNVLKKGIWFGLAGMSVLLFNQVDKVMLGLMISEKSVGYYQASYRIYEIFVLFIILFSQILFPKMTNYFHNNKNKFKKFFLKIKWIYFIVPFTIIGFIATFSNQIIFILYGNEYKEISSKILIFLIFSIIPVALNNLYGNYILIKGKERLFAFATFIGLIVNVILNIILIPYFSYYGATVATFFSEFVTFLFVFLKRN